LDLSLNHLTSIKKLYHGETHILLRHMGGTTRRIFVIDLTRKSKFLTFDHPFFHWERRKMIKKLLVLLCVMLFFFGIVGAANASLTTIGTASFDGETYHNLIYEDDSIDGGLVWLDYTKSQDDWQAQVDWASGLGGSLTVDLYAGVTTDIDWSTVSA
jgi:hypothetical protein